MGRASNLSETAGARAGEPRDGLMLRLHRRGDPRLKKARARVPSSVGTLGQANRTRRIGISGSRVNGIDRPIGRRSEQGRREA